MTLLHRPVYNPGLDRAFSKRNGRVSNPARFGLTKNQIGELKEAGQWELFLRKWYAKRLRFLVHNRLTCTICGSTTQNGVVILKQRICRSCCAEIKELVNVPNSSTCLRT